MLTFSNSGNVCSRNALSHGPVEGHRAVDQRFGVQTDVGTFTGKCGKLSTVS